MTDIFLLIVTLWLLWLLLDGLLTGSVWVRGGAADRFSRPLDMKSFAHKVNRADAPGAFWVGICFYLAAIIFFLAALLMDW